MTYTVEWPGLQADIDTLPSLGPTTETIRITTDTKGESPIYIEHHRRREVGVERLKQLILADYGLRDELAQVFPTATEEHITDGIGKIATAQFAGHTPEAFALATDKLYGDFRHQRSRYLKDTAFGQGIFVTVPNPSELFPDIQSRIPEDRYVLGPAGIVAYDMHVSAFGKEQKPLDALVIHVFYLSIGWMSFKKRMKTGPWLTPRIGGESDRIWDQKSLTVLQGHKQMISESVKRGCRILSYHLSHPYPGGLPGLGSRS